MLSVPTIFLLSTFGVISKTIVDVVNLNLEFNRIEKEMNTEKTKIIFNHKILSDYFLNYKNNKNKIDHTISIKLKPTQFIVGYDDELKPIIVDFKRTPHAGVMGGSEMGKSKCVETMIASNPYIDVSLVNAFEEDFTSLNVNRINGIEEIKAFLKAELDNKEKRSRPHVIVIDECNVLSLTRGMDDLIKGLLAQGRHFNVYIIAILQLANKNDCSYKNLFNVRISFRHLDTDLITTFIGSKPDEILKPREFFMYDVDYKQGVTYTI